MLSVWDFGPNVTKIVCQIVKDFSNFSKAQNLFKTNFCPNVGQNRIHKQNFVPSQDINRSFASPQPLH